ncbi:hypothetical protein C0995_008337 [Termitomyces sp. Mi166|nr:hypothetical protein C0995_008337 [Termitomyces sp. Mi166\
MSGMVMAAMMAESSILDNYPHLCSVEGATVGIPIVEVAADLEEYANKMIAAGEAGSILQVADNTLAVLALSLPLPELPEFSVCAQSE